MNKPKIYDDLSVWISVYLLLRHAARAATFFVRVK